MLAAALCILSVADTSQESVTVRKFSLVTDEGENVLHADFDRRRLADSSFDRLAFRFYAFGKHFEFELERSYPILAPGATIKMTSRVRSHNKSTSANP